MINLLLLQYYQPLTFKIHESSPKSSCDRIKGGGLSLSLSLSLCVCVYEDTYGLSFAFGISNLKDVC